MAAKKEADSVAVIKEACMADARRIAGEKGDAEEDLAQARPFLEEAERAVESIKVIHGEFCQGTHRLRLNCQLVSFVFTSVSILLLSAGRCVGTYYEGVLRAHLSRV